MVFHQTFDTGATEIKTNYFKTFSLTVLAINIHFKKYSSFQDACMKTYPKNGLYGLQRVGNDGCNSFGNSTDHEDLNGRELGE